MDETQTPPYELDTSTQRSIHISESPLQQHLNQIITETTELPPDHSPSPANNSLPQQLPTPPPGYQGRELYELALIAEIKLDFNKPPGQYFSSILPMRLEDRIPNMAFASRIKSLNDALAAPEMQRSIWFATNFTNGSAVVGLFSAFAGFTLAYITKNETWLGFLAVGLLAVIPIPFTPKYAKRAQEIVDLWTKEDEAQEINLTWNIKKTFTRSNRSLVSLTVCVFERIRIVEGDEIIQHIEALPLYVEREHHH
ncbi:hypothetical protein HK100_012343 [Physocladia obscura]|uniref:Uncharacterized protein n=1 Tax=Physocladia obscura TaxID=109957 RepID=A0AAD5SZZ1_9FUNG|nr:hypothetical protein HK100_012343 [Physocladia obscura]